MDIQSVLRVLQKSILSKELTDIQIQELLLFATPKSFAKGDVVYTRGGTSDNTFCLILSGSVHIIDKEKGLVAVRKSGEVIGELALFVPGHQRTFSVQAMEPVELLEWNIQFLGKLLPILKQKLFAFV
jgi:CRP-like cAMP-binding protein